METKYEEFTAQADNYQRWTYNNAANLVQIPSKWTLDDLFYNLAQRAQYFPSNDRRGNLLNTESSWFTGWPPNPNAMLVDIAGFPCDPGSIFRCYIKKNDLVQIGDSLMPLAIQYTARLYELFWNEVHNLIPVPNEKDIFDYPPFFNPYVSTSPRLAKPVGLGPVATGGDTLTIQVALNQFSGPVDIYGAFMISTDPQTIVNVKSDLTFQTFSIQQIEQALKAGSPPTGAVPLMSNVTTAINVTLFNIPTSSLSPGTYNVFLLVTPAGNMGAYYLWTTYFEVSYSIVYPDIPTVPTGLTATLVSSSQINLSWNPSTSKVGISGYHIYRNGAYLKSVNSTTASDTGLSPSTQYCYRVTAYNALGNESGTSNQACVTTPPLPGRSGIDYIGSLVVEWDIYQIPQLYGFCAFRAFVTNTSHTQMFGHLWYNAFNSSGNKIGYTITGGIFPSNSKILASDKMPIAQLPDITKIIEDCSVIHHMGYSPGDSYIGSY